MAQKKVSEEKYIKMCNDLNDHIEKAYQAMKELNTNFNALMKGDSEGPYWNGSSAKAFYTETKNNLNNSIAIYKEATEVWASLELRYINLLRKGYFR